MVNANFLSEKYDAVIVMGGGLRMDQSEEYRPSTYLDSDGFGMLGGQMRVNAAGSLFHLGATDTFVFTGGKYEKNIEKFGTNVPHEAKVYERAFKEKIGPEKHSESHSKASPNIVLELKSRTTLEEIRHVLHIAYKHKWHKVGMLTNTYHIPRVKALTEMIRKQSMYTTKSLLTFIDAEGVVISLEPGKYDEEINKAYSSREAAKRVRNEKRGLGDITSGSYATAEYQLVQRNKRTMS